MLSIFPQVIANSIIAGSLYLLVVLGFNLIFGTSKFFDLGYGAMTTVGAYGVFFLATQHGVSLPFAIVIAIILSGLVGLLFYKLIYKKLRKKKASNLVLLIASLGVLTLADAIIAIIFTSQFRSLTSTYDTAIYTWFTVSVTSTQIWMTIIALALSIFTLLFLKFSYFGKAINAVRDDEEVSKIVGIDSEKIMSVIFFAGSAIGGIAGIFFGLDIGIEPRMGFELLLKGIIVSIIGGAGSISGGIFGAYLLGFVENFGILYIGSEWKNAIAFILLIIFLLFRPSGIMKK